MMTIKIIRILHLASYLIIASQLVFYLLALSDAFKLVTIENFLEQRKSVDSLMNVRYKIAYYSCLALSLLVVVLSSREQRSAFFITSVIAIICLAADMLIAINGNIPLNELTNNYVPGSGNTNWEEVREKWLLYMKYRGMLTGTGMISLMAGLVFGRS